MRLRALSALVVWIAAAGAIRAQQAETLPYDHMHLAAPDRAKALEWYMAHMGATLHELGDRVVVSRVMFTFFERADSPPSEGSVIDHIGFSFADLDAKMREFEAAGVKILSPVRDVPGLFKLAFIEDPWGVKIEVVQDPDTLGFHHIHLRVPDPARTFAWYVEHFGGERARLKDRLDGVRYRDGLWLLAQRVDGAPPSIGRAIDHLGWRVRDIDSVFAGYRTQGETITMEPRMIRDVRAGVIEDPDGVRIELAQRPQY